MFHALQKKTAESLIETMVAITVIVLATTAAMTLVRTSLIGNQVIGEKVIALNLALEGIEAVRNIRDTNYLRFASDPDTCWNTLGATDVTLCGTADTIDEGKIYYLRRNFNAATGSLFEWALFQVTSSKHGWIDLYDIPVNMGSAGLVHIPMYAQSNLPSTIGFTVLEDDVFYRTLEFSYNGPDSFDATVTVEWQVGDALKSLSLTRTIAHVY